MNVHREAVGVMELQEEARSSAALARRLHDRSDDTGVTVRQQVRAAQLSRAARSYYERWAATVGTRTKDQGKDEGRCSP